MNKVIMIGFLLFVVTMISHLIEGIYKSNGTPLTGDSLFNMQLGISVVLFIIYAVLKDKSSKQNKR